MNSRQRGIVGERVLAIDPGTKCGWALLDGDDLRSGVWTLRNNKSDKHGKLYLRLHGHLIDVGVVDVIYYELVRRHMGVAAAHMYGAYVGILQAWCESFEPDGIPCIGVPVGTIKKHATGKGNAKKPAMISAAKEKWPKQRVKDDNQADALWILDCGLKLKEANGNP